MLARKCYKLIVRYILITIHSVAHALASFYKQRNYRTENISTTNINKNNSISSAACLKVCFYVGY